jgi:ABC-type uncharacterized transport system substrate-binding protein
LRRSVQSWIEIGPFRLDKSRFLTAVNNRFRNYRLRDSLRIEAAMKKFGWSSILVAVVLFAVAVIADAQQPTKIPRVGFLSGREKPTAATPDPSADAFRRGLQDLGYIEGKNILIEYRYLEAKLDNIPRFVNELVQLNVDVLCVLFNSGLLAAKQATKTIPIVMVTTEDPVAAGLVDSLAHPGGNITGLTRLTRGLSGKRLQLLKEVVPRMLRVGVLWNTDASGSTVGSKEYKAAARAMKIEFQALELRGPNPDLEGAFQAAAKGRVSALVTVRDPVVSRYRKEIADFTVKNRLPSMHERADYVDAGGLMSYVANDTEIYRRAATYVDKIIKGAKPADLPVEQPTKFEFVSI